MPEVHIPEHVLSSIQEQAPFDLFNLLMEDDPFEGDDLPDEVEDLTVFVPLRKFQF